MGTCRPRALALWSPAVPAADSPATGESSSRLRGGQGRGPGACRMTRKTIGSYGPSRATVRVFTEGDLVRVQWREAGRVLTKSWGNTPANRTEAKAWAKGFAEAK